MLELHYPTVTKTILERQYPGKPTLKVAFGNGNGAIFENSSKLRASLLVTSRWPRSLGQTNYQVHHPPPLGGALWAVRAQRKGNHCRYFIFFQKSGRPMFCSCLVFYLTIFLLPDLEKRDENQEIEKTKVSGGRMTDNFWRSVWNPIQVLFILKVLWIKVLINPNL